MLELYLASEGRDLRIFHLCVSIAFPKYFQSYGSKEGGFLGSFSIAYCCISAVTTVSPDRHIYPLKYFSYEESRGIKKTSV